jgi:hypothetical protein
MFAGPWNSYRYMMGMDKAMGISSIENPFPSSQARRRELTAAFCLPCCLARLSLQTKDFCFLLDIWLYSNWLDIFFVTVYCLEKSAILKGQQREMFFLPCHYM